MTRWAALVSGVNRICRAGSLLAGLAGLAATCMITFGVTMRYFFGRPQVFVDELATFLLVVVVFCGLAHTFRSNGHITVDLLSSRLEPGPRAWLRVITLLLGSSFVGIVAWQTLEATLRAYRLGRVSVVMLYPLWIPHLFMPLGLALLLLAMLVSLTDEGRRLVGGGVNRTRSVHGSPD